DDAGRDRAHHPRGGPHAGRARHPVQRARRGRRAAAAKALPARRAAIAGSRVVSAGGKVRLRAVSFLNARPITYGLERGVGQEEYNARFDLSFDLPSRCAEALRAGEVDLALMPSASYADLSASMELR